MSRSPNPKNRLLARRLQAASLVCAMSLVLLACGGGSDADSTAPSFRAWQAALTGGDTSGVDERMAVEATLELLQSKLTDEAETRTSVLGAPWHGRSSRQLGQREAMLLSEAGSRQALVSGVGGTGLDWNPSHDSVTLTVLDQFRNHVLLASNWRYKGSGPATGRALAVAGADPTTGARYAAFGGNPLAVRGNAAMDQVMHNLLGWLTGRSSLGGLRVVTAHLPGTATYWFPHEAPTRSWLTAHLPSVTINGVAGAAATDDGCDGSALAGCLQSADLLIIGRQETPHSGTSTYIGSAVMQAIRAAQARGLPVLYLHHDGDTNDLAGRMLHHLGLSSEDNYWAQEGLRAFDPSTLRPNSYVADALALLNRLETGSFTTTFSGCVNNFGRTDCSADNLLQSEFLRTAEAIRSTLRSLDAQGRALFHEPGYSLEKHLVLVGDTYRRGVSYPMDKMADKAAFFRALFSDMTAYYNRRHSGTARHQGSFASAIAPDTPALSRTVTTTAPATGTRELMTGLYVMPGRTVTLTRSDTSGATVTTGINMLRDTTRAYNANGYDRPTMLSSPRMPLVSGRTVTITSPFGGPLFLFVGATSGATDITVAVNGVTTHPVLRDMNDAAQVAAFKAELESTPTNWVGIGTDFLTVHSNLTHMRSTLAAHGGDMGLLAERIGTYMVRDTYELAGFNTTSGSFSLPENVTAFCSAAGWDCAGAQHRRDVMQHVIADTVAQCGAGCSGNPYDQNWALEPLGWGETHEIGHNLQRARLNIYGGQSGEVSNNIFPVHKQMAFNRSAQPASPLKAREGSTAEVFNGLKASLQPGASPTHMRDALWSNTAYAANNSARLNFYRQLVEYARHYNNALRDGWELYTLLYLLERNFSASSTSANWSSLREAMGFGTYASHPSAINGNDFMLIAASRIIGRDMRPVWNLWGVTYSDAAAAQVAAYGHAAAEPLLFPMKDLNAFGTGVGAPVSMSATASYPAGF